MAFIHRILEAPSYGYEVDGKLYIPSKKELFALFFKRLNVFKDRKNWLAFYSWVSTLAFGIPLMFFLFEYFTWPLFALGFFYSMFVVGTHATIYYHRFSTHRGFQFTHPFWLFFTRNLVVKIVPEELYVVSHHVHHAISEQPGDPYNVNAGWWYCFLADAVHQPIHRNLPPKDYERVTSMLKHTGIHINSYEQYQKWGSVSHPGKTVSRLLANWAFWYGVFYLIGGHALATCLFGWCGVWGIGVRTFNFDGHGGGKDKRKDGVDFNRKDLSINQLWPGLVTGEWHNNHHLFPNGARAGFLPHQLDYAWYYIKALHFIGGIKTYTDNLNEFNVQFYHPYLEKTKKIKTPLAQQHA